MNEIEEIKDRLTVVENRLKAVLDKNTSLMAEIYAYKSTLQQSKKPDEPIKPAAPQYMSGNEEIKTKGMYLKKTQKLWYVLDASRVVIAGPWQSKAGLINDLKIRRTNRIEASLYRIIR